MFSLKCSPTSYSSIFLDKGKTKTKKKQSKDKVQPFPPSTSPPLVPCIIYIKGSFGVFHSLAFYQKITRRELKGEASLFCLIDLFAFFSSLFSLYNISTIYKCGEWEDEHNSKEVAQSQNLQQTLRFALLFSVTIFPFTFIFYYTSYL